MSQHMVGTQKLGIKNQIKAGGVAQAARAPA
jgi:hypothetical protein